MPTREKDTVVAAVVEVAAVVMGEHSPIPAQRHALLLPDPTPPPGPWPSASGSKEQGVAWD